MALSKGLKIGFGIAGFLLLIGLLVWIFKGSVAGNKYGSADAVKAGKSGSDGKWTDAATANKPGYDALYSIPNRPMGYFSDGIFEIDAYGQAWFKGMNIALTAANVSKYGVDIAKYANDASIRKPHWSVTVGSFLS